MTDTTILAIDDDDMNLEMIDIILSDTDYKILKAGNGLEAIQVLEGNPDIDTFLVDLEMPVMDGFEFITYVRQSPQWLAVPVIVITGSASEVNRTLMMGANDFVSKPFNREELRLRIMNQIRNKKESDLAEMYLRNREDRLAQERKQTEIELKQMQIHMIQQEKMASIGQMAAGVAHEINKPAGFIASNLATLDKYGQKIGDYIQFLEKAFLECNGGEWPDSVKTVRTSLKIDHILSDMGGLFNETLDGVDRVKSIVKDLKSFSRSDDQQIALLDLNQCIHSTLNIVRNEYKYVAELLLDLQVDLPPLRGNSHNLCQVIANLVVNAAQAIDDQGTITIRTWQDDYDVLMSVSDTGKGIPAEHLSQVFDPFFTTKEAGNGTGLGLSITRDIINKHNGEITLESTIGKGSTFTIRLPFESKL
ncbi:MAG: sensor histidine kinase [Desulfuromonadaceae bacterium]